MGAVGTVGAADVGGDVGGDVWAEPDGDCDVVVVAAVCLLRHVCYSTALSLCPVPLLFPTIPL